MAKPEKAARREAGAFGVDPVTGKMRKLAASATADGVNTHRDGCMIVDDRYINAAKELGLGNEKGMYSHIKAFNRMGATDLPEGTSMQHENAASKSARPSAPSTAPSGSGYDVKTVAKTVGGAKVHGIAGGGGGKPSIHHHEDAFQRRKGVVNTVGGAKDVNRATRDEAPRLPAKGERKGAQIMGFGTLDAHTAEGKARREAAEKRESAGGNAHKMNLVKVTGGGGRHADLGGNVSLPLPKRPAPAVSAPSSAGAEAPRARPTASTNVLGGNSAASNAQPASADELRAKRMAYFEAQAAEKEAKKAAAR